MKFNHRNALFLVVPALFVLVVAIFGNKAGAQDNGWWIVRAVYGTRAQHNDVTDILKDLIGRGGVNGRVAVNNQTMGGDPAIGADKHLWITARNDRSQEREFEYKEGGFIDVAMYNVRREDRRDDWSDRPPSAMGRDQNDNGLRIIRAYYGVQGRTNNVTDILRNQVRDGVLSMIVSNNALGGDPAVGADKVLIVVYRFQGTETAIAVPERATITLP
ncbi:MAG TPA: DUF3395 domain-containing protein [Candidatus Acidoferrum sp.]|nr:DUF3395 domain-containing protein [Candidatus Acidoferrum sp.]